MRLRKAERNGDGTGQDGAGPSGAWDLIPTPRIDAAGPIDVVPALALLHAKRGIALMDIAPHRTLAAEHRLRTALVCAGLPKPDAARLPIAYLSVERAELPLLPWMLEAALDTRPRPDPVAAETWLPLARAVLDPAGAHEAPPTRDTEPAGAVAAKPPRDEPAEAVADRWPRVAEPEADAGTIAATLAVDKPAGAMAGRWVRIAVLAGATSTAGLMLGLLDPLLRPASGPARSPSEVALAWRGAAQGLTAKDSIPPPPVVPVLAPIPAIRGVPLPVPHPAAVPPTPLKTAEPVLLAAMALPRVGPPPPPDGPAIAASTHHPAPPLAAPRRQPAIVAVAARSAAPAGMSTRPGCAPLLARLQLGGLPTHADRRQLATACAPRD